MTDDWRTTGGQSATNMLAIPPTEEITSPTLSHMHMHTVHAATGWDTPPD